MRKCRIGTAKFFTLLLLLYRTSVKDLGINAIELMPIFEFDELSGRREVDGRELVNYWGYNTVGFFAPNTSYASAVEYNREGMEFKQLVKSLHENGIEVILDVVFNHTAEGNEDLVPKQAYTMGIRTIMQARKVLMVASGKDKAEILKKAFFGPVTPEVPASILQMHPDFILVADEDALSLI